MKHSCLILAGACGILLAFPHFQGFHTLFHTDRSPQVYRRRIGFRIVWVKMPAPVFQLWNGGPRGLVRANASSSVGREKICVMDGQGSEKATARSEQIVSDGAGVHFY